MFLSTLVHSYAFVYSMTTLELAEALTTQSSHDVEKTLLLLEPLQKILEKATPSNNLRELVIRSLYVHIDNEDERILVAIARAMLTVNTDFIEFYRILVV